MDLTFKMHYVPVVYHVCSRRNEARLLRKFSEFFLLTLYYIIIQRVFAVYGNV